MNQFSAREARSRFSDILNRVAYAHEQIAIRRRGKEPVYLISSQDYDLFQQLLELHEDRADIQLADERMSNPEQERVSFETFFEELGI
jgi:prevent-host-death family protein